MVWAFRRVVLGWVGVCAVAGAAVLGSGCTSINKRLNPPTVAVERRVHNQTRAATGTSTAPIESRDTERVRADSARDESGIAGRDAARRNGGRAVAAAAEIPDVHPDGCFVGLALSGGGSRSANFSAACMFQLQRLGVLQHVD